MLRIIPDLKRGLAGALAVLLTTSTLLTPAAVFADTSQTCTPPSSTQAGVHKPVGADANTYTYNCTTGLWENAHYSYDPATGLVTAKDPVIYTYNATTGGYDYTTWVYDAPSDTYVPVTSSAVQPPAGATVVGAPAPSTSSPGSSSISNTGPGSNNTITGNGGLGGSIDNTGPDSNNTINGSNTNTFNGTDTTNALINNLLLGQASTGNAMVLGNTTGGNATSGNAQDIATAVNMLQSSSNALSGGAVTFVANIDGDVNGDLLLDPATLGTVQPSAAPALGNNNLTINNQTNATINNNINLAANSGDATVANNTTGGNATSGSAQAIANVVNLINSAVSSGHSFLGVININGNLNGDILVPPNLIDQLIASNVPTLTISNTGPNSNNAIQTNNNSNTTTVTNTNNQGITNNVNGTATSGQATVSGNTTVGNATSGSAATNITAFNLTGSNVIGANDMLVFVNVLGTWVGMIVNAPAGATAAELGGGITTNAPNGSNNNTTVNNTTNDQINNNITTSATSGNADVSNNTNGGNATSGNAKNAVNLLNVENSNLSLSGWFGILFINVFGNWNGSFGVNTAAGDAPAGGAAGAGSSSDTATIPATIQAFRFVPRTSSTAASGGTSGGGFSTAGTGTVASSVLASHNVKLSKNGAPSPQLQTAHSSYLLPLTGIVLFALYAIGDAIHTRRQSHTKTASAKS